MTKIGKRIRSESGRPEAVLSLGVPLYLWFLLRVCTRLGWSGRPGESGLVDELDGSVEEERRIVEEAVREGRS